MTRPRVLLYAQHILGIGHLVRAARIAQAMERAGMDVTVVLGGMPVDGVDWGSARLQYLPAIRAGEGGYADLVDAEGRPVDDSLREVRRGRLIEMFEALRPDIVLVEAFPFGRRAMRFELIPALEAARSWDRPPVVASSIRDILHENRKAHLNAQTAELVERLFDLVLVHGDPQLIALGESFPEADRIGACVRYTGIVAPDAPGALKGPAAEVVVSAGGGAVGQLLFQTALEAHDLCAAGQASWCFITGPNLDDDAAERLRERAASNVRVEQFRSDFVALLGQARLSISQAGYNTSADILRAGCRSILVPSTYQGETEQTRRAHLLGARGLARVVAEGDLSAERLAGVIDDIWEVPVAVNRPVPDLNGADATARLLLAAERER